MFGDTGWVIEVLAKIFISCFDRFAYWLAAVAYEIFSLESKVNIFGGKGPLMNIYDGFTKRIYTILSIVMVFIFAYQLLMLIVNPDGGKDGAGAKSSALVKDSIISIVAIAALPLIFRYMTIFQNHIIDEQILMKLVLGPEANFTTGDNPGREVAMITMLSFFHPVNTSASTFRSISAEAAEAGFESADVQKALSECIAKTQGYKKNEDVCEAFTKGLVEWRNDPDNSPKVLLNDDVIINQVNKTVEYYWVISTACAILLSWFFITYAIDLGTRAVKLAFLELIAPIPLILRIMPNSKKSFDNWKNEILRTYLDVFIRVAVVAFIVQLCVMVPDIKDALFQTVSSSITGSGGTAGDIVLGIFVVVGLILGLLKFAKEAPTLLKAVFATGGSLFEGLNLKPGVKARIEENELAMKGISAGANVVGRTRSTFNKYKGNEKGLRGVGLGAWGVIRNGGKNLVGGIKDGAGENSAKKFGELQTQYHAGGKSGNKVANDTINYGFESRVKAVKTQMGGVGVGATAGDKTKAFFTAVSDAYKATPKAKARASHKRQEDAIFKSGSDETLMNQAAEVSQAVGMVTAGYTQTMEKAIANLEKVDETVLSGLAKNGVYKYKYMGKDADGKDVAKTITLKSADEWDDFKSQVKYEALGKKMADATPSNAAVNDANMANALTEITNLTSSNKALADAFEKYLSKGSTAKIMASTGMPSSLEGLKSLASKSDKKAEDYAALARVLDGAKKTITFETTLMSERQKFMEPKDTK